MSESAKHMQRIEPVELFNPIVLGSFLTTAVAEARKESATALVLWTVADNQLAAVMLTLDDNGRPDLSTLNVYQTGADSQRDIGASIMLKAYLIYAFEQIRLQLV